MDNLKTLSERVDTDIDPAGSPGSVLASNHNEIEKTIISQTGKYVGSPFTAKGGDNSVVETGEIFIGDNFQQVAEILIYAAQKTNDLVDFGLTLATCEGGDLIHFKDFVGRSAFFIFDYYTAEKDANSNDFYLIRVKGLADNLNYEYQVGESELCVVETIKNQAIKSILERVGLILGWAKYDGVAVSPDFSLYAKTITVANTVFIDTFKDVLVRLLIVQTKNFELIQNLNPKVIIERYSPHKYKRKDALNDELTYQVAGYKKHRNLLSNPRISEFDMTSEKFIQDIGIELYFKNNKYPIPKGIGKRNFVISNLSGAELAKGYVYLRFKIQMTVGGVEYESEPKVHLKVVATKKNNSDQSLICYSMTQ